MSDESFTRAERTDLQRLARMTANVARGGIDAAKAQRLHEFERELQARYEVDNEAWAELAATAEAQVRTLDQELAKRCEDLGIGRSFGPLLTCTGGVPVRTARRSGPSYVGSRSSSSTPWVSGPSKR